MFEQSQGYISPNARIGKNVSIGLGAIIYDNVEIGIGVIIYYIVQNGNDFYIGPYSFIWKIKNKILFEITF